jgi:hypothetical protein
MDDNELFVIAAALGGAILGCVLGALLMIFFF